MRTHKSQNSESQFKAGSFKNNPFMPRPFEVTYPGQEIASSATNPFPRRPYEVWSVDEPIVTPAVQAKLNAQELEMERSKTRLFAANNLLFQPHLSSSIPLQLKPNQSSPPPINIDEIAVEIKTRTQTQLQEFSTNALQANEKKGNQYRQFPLIVKYICRHVLYKQIDSPKKLNSPKIKPYQLGEDYVRALGLEKKDVIFPELYEDDFVGKLKLLSKKQKKELKARVISDVLDSIEGYVDQKMGTTPDGIREEFDLLSPRTKSLIEGGLEGYFACRVGLLNTFGSTNNPQAALQKANEYYASLQTTNFLSGILGSEATFVHPSLAIALEGAEKFLNDQGWMPEVLSSIQSYWSTNIRENRNSPARLSDHSFGWALDIDASANPNLAKFGQQNWQFIEQLLGEDVFKVTGKQDTEAVKAIKTESDSEKILKGVQKLRSQSDKLKGFFAKEENLKARLAEILQQAGVVLPSTNMAQLFDLAKQSVVPIDQKAPKKVRQKQQAEQKKFKQQLLQTIEAALWQQHPASAINLSEENTPLVAQIYKSLAKTIQTIERFQALQGSIESLIKNPSAKPAKGARIKALQPLYQKKLVQSLETLTESQRATIVQAVLNHLRVSLERQQVKKRSQVSSAFLLQAFSVFRQTRQASGAPIDMGAGLPNIAAHGFTNLPPKLTTALVSSQGGNLNWLGVANQDMHHFELKTEPALPKASQ